MILEDQDSVVAELEVQKMIDLLFPQVYGIGLQRLLGWVKNFTGWEEWMLAQGP